MTYEDMVEIYAKIDDTIDAIAEDMKDGFRRIADSVEMVYKQDENTAN